MLPMPDPGDLLAYAPLITGQRVEGTLVVLTAQDTHFNGGIHIPATSHATLQDVVLGPDSAIRGAYQLAVLAYDIPARETPGLVASIRKLRDACETAGACLAGAWQTCDRDWATLLTGRVHGPAAGATAATGSQRAARLLGAYAARESQMIDTRSTRVALAWAELARHRQIAQSRTGRTAVRDQMAYARLRATAETSTRDAYLQSARTGTQFTIGKRELPLVLLMLHDTHVLLDALVPLSRMTPAQLDATHTGWQEAAAACPAEGKAPVAAIAATAAYLAGNIDAAVNAATAALAANPQHILAQLVNHQVTAGSPPTELRSGVAYLADQPGAGKPARHFPRTG